MTIYERLLRRMIRLRRDAMRDGHGLDVQRAWTREMRTLITLVRAERERHARGLPYAIASVIMDASSG